MLTKLNCRDVVEKQNSYLQQLEKVNIADPSGRKNLTILSFLVID